MTTLLEECEAHKDTINTSHNDMFDSAYYILYIIICILYVSCTLHLASA